MMQDNDASFLLTMLSSGYYNEVRERSQVHCISCHLALVGIGRMKRRNVIGGTPGGVDGHCASFHL